MQGSVRTSDLGRIEERMGPMEDNIGRIVQLLQHQDGNIPKEEELDQGSHEEKQ